MQTAAALTAIDQMLRAVEEAAFARGFSEGKAAGISEGGSALRCLTKRQVWTKLGISEDSLDLLCREDRTFPKSFWLLRRKMWREHEVDAWINKQ